MKTSESIKSITLPRENRIGISDNSKAKHDKKYELDESEICGGKIDGNEIGDDKVGRKVKKHLSPKNCPRPKR